MIDAEAVITRLRETDARSGGRREAWRDGWVAERRRLDELVRSISDSITVQTDAFANGWYVLPGESSETVLVGSHSDCVPGGGWLDGILGVHAGLGVLAATAAGPRPRRTLAVVDWADEEGTRFGRSLLGASAATGALTASELGGLTGGDGRAAAEIVSQFGFDPGALAADASPPDRSGLRSPRLAQVVAACELHIEQGPTLERAGRSVGAVSGCLGVRRERITFTGVAGHAGSTPLAQRRDPVRDAARLVASLSDAAQAADGLATVGLIESDPAIATAVARHCRLSLDLRHADLDSLLALEARTTQLLAESRCAIDRVSLYRQDPVAFDPALVALATSVCGGGDPVVSGPLHDSAALAQAGIATVMLFCPSLGGISHSRDEDTNDADLIAGVQALHRLVTQLLDGDLTGHYYVSIGVRRLGPALEVRDFKLWWLALMGMGISLQMMEVAIGWEVYALHRSALDLGWIGLAEFVPMFVLALPAGQLADRVPRRLIFAGALLLGCGVGVGLAVISGSGVTSVLPYLALAVGSGTAMALGTPAARAMTPTLVPPDLLRSAMTLRSIATQSGQVAGPAIGGLLYGVSSSLVYLLAAASCLVACGFALAMHPGTVAETDEAALASAPGLQSVSEGLVFVGRTPILLGAILLDLLAVLFGGAVALLPIFARTILHVGAAGLGVLRAAPAIGALLAATVVTRRPIAGRAGRLLLTVVLLYGASMVVFGLSRTFVISLVALGVSGFVDLYSMNIRSTTVALATPDRLRGRVNAVEMVFISASNQLGAFESGLAASLVGAVPAVVGGGIMTMLIALSWARIFPALAEVDRLESIQPISVAESLL